MEKKITRELPVKLTEEGKKARSNKLAEITLEVDKIVGEKTLACAGFNDQLKEKRKEIRALAKAVNSGEETVEVECFERQIFSTNTVEVVRADTGEVIEQRAMTADERNEPLDFEGKKKTKLKTKKGDKTKNSDGTAESPEAS